VLPLAPRGHADLIARFAWKIPARFNIAAACCDVWADGTGRTALILPAPRGVRRWSFDNLRAASSRLAHVLAAEIQGFVRSRLAAHEYPREIAFVDALPLTTTGKIIRRALRDAKRAVTEQSSSGPR